MKETDFEQQFDELAQLREAWQEHKRHVGDLPGLSDEALQRLFADYCRQHGGALPPTRRRTLVWQQVLSAVVCLAAAVCCAVVCVRMWDDLPYRLLLGVVAAGSLLSAVWCVCPHYWLLFRCYRRERLETAYADGRPPHVGYAVRSLLPLGVVAFVILAIAARVPIGDGYNMATASFSRLGAVDNITLLLSHLA